MQIIELVRGIRELDFVLPEFQREYVWGREQAKQLLVSLLRGYPTGSLLLWKTSDPPEIKNNAIARDRIGTTSVILDGQQHLTTLYLLTQDAIPPYYRPQDIQTDPRNLYYDLETGDLQFYLASRMEKGSTWVSVTECFRTPSIINVFELAQARAEDSSEAMALARRYNDNLNRLTNIRVADYPVQLVPSDADIEDAIDVFDRVNSQGTKLSEAELALAHITGKWPQARRVMKETIDRLATRGFAFDLTFMVRALTAVVRGRALFDTVHDAKRDDLEAGWVALEKILDYLTTMLPTWACIHSQDDISSTNVLIPAVAFLAFHHGAFAGEAEVRAFVRWLYAASTWARYSSQTTQRLEHDVSLAVQNPNPWKKLVDAIIDQRGRIDLKASDLEGRGVQHPFYRMTFVLAKLNGAVDWYTGEPLVASHSNAWHSHHIFPQSRLYGEGGYSPESHVDQQMVNEIANRAFLSAGSNYKVGTALPDQSLAEVEDRYPGALEKQFVPANRKLWTLEQFEAFLGQRRELVAEAYNREMARLTGNATAATRQSVAELITAGESASLEFKSSLRWSLDRGNVDKELQKVVAKTVAGFLNSEGGTLLIGVADDGSPVGIEYDIKTIPRRDRDGFEQSLVQTLANYLGPEFAPYVHTSYEAIDGHTVCRIEVDRSPKPVYLKDGQGTEFYARYANTTRPLDTQAAHEYIAMHWAP